MSLPKLDALRRRRRERERKEASVPTPTLPTHLPTYPSSTGDLWLVRTSYLAQAGVLLATVLGFYFTVIPLYQKALLEEAIAQREIELKASQAGVADARDQLRLAQAEISVAKAQLKAAQTETASTRRFGYEQLRANFVAHYAKIAAEDCSGVYRANISGAQGDNPNPPDAGVARRNAMLNLSARVDDCLLTSAVANEAKKFLDKSDLTYFTSSLKAIALPLDERRIGVSARIEELPSALSDSADLDLIPGLSGMSPEQRTGAMKNITSRMDASQLKQLHLAAIERTQLRLAREFRWTCNNQIREALLNLAWPKPVTSTGASAAR